MEESSKNFLLLFFSQSGMCEMLFSIRKNSRISIGLFSAALLEHLHHHNFFHISQHGRQWFTFQMMVKVGVVAIIQHAMTNVNFSLVLGAKSRHSNYDIKILYYYVMWRNICETRQHWNANFSPLSLSSLYNFAHLRDTCSIIQTFTYYVIYTFTPKNYKAKQEKGSRDVFESK